MTLTYIFHSGFVIETEQSILVFDYWLDPSGVMEGVLKKDKPLYVFSSHFHEDHFTKKIFEWKKLNPDITYILSKDIYKHRRASKEDSDVWLAKGGTWSNKTISVWALGSTDSGVSWIVETEGKRFFHAGDLNNWYAKFLLDDNPDQLRYSNGYTLGGRQFIERFKVGLFVPMHFTTGFEPSWRMKEFTDEKGISFWEITKEGETIELRHF